MMHSLSLTQQANAFSFHYFACTQPFNLIILSSDGKIPTQAKYRGNTGVCILVLCEKSE